VEKKEPPRDTCLVEMALGGKEYASISIRGGKEGRGVRGWGSSLEGKKRFCCIEVRKNASRTKKRDGLKNKREKRKA